LWKCKWRKHFKSSFEKIDWSWSEIIYLKLKEYIRVKVVDCVWRKTLKSEV
jgi:hypothetical protein